MQGIGSRCSGKLFGGGQAVLLGRSGSRLPAAGRLRVLWLLAALLLLCAACTTVEPAQGVSIGVHTGEIAGTHTAGQTFVAQHDGLAAVDVLLATYARPNTGTLTLHLRADPEAPDDLRTTTVDMARIADNAYQRFAFTPLPDSAGQSYYFVLAAPEAAPGNAVTAWRGNPLSYLDGGLYLDGQSVDGQLTFRLAYAEDAAVAGLAVSVLRSLPAALAIAALFVLPGLALLLWLARPIHDLWALLLLAPGVTLALVPLLMLPASLLGVRLGLWAPWSLAAAGALGIGLAIVRRRLPLRPAFGWSDLALLVVAALVVVMRFLMVRTMEVPAWGDSVQHAMIVQLMLDQGGLPASWEPYAPFSTFTAQYGFHAAAALVAWLTALPMPRVVVVAGQLVNALAVLALYPLGARLSGDRWGGVVAVVAGGLLSAVPAIYLNWGRYPQLAGQAVLPAAAYFLLPREESEAALRAAREGLRTTLARWEITPGEMLLTGVTAAGMLLVSYRMLHFFGVLALALWLMYGLVRVSPAARRRAFGQLAMGAAIAAALVIPWQVSASAGRLDDTLASSLATPANWQRVLSTYEIWRLVPDYIPLWLLALAGLGLGWAVVRGRRGMLAVGLWTAGLAALPVLRLVRFPTLYFFDNFGLVIALYMPAAWLAGWLAAEAVRLARRLVPRAAGPLALAAVVIAAGWGARQFPGLRDRFYDLVTVPDVAALNWVRANVPPDALFAVNGFTVSGRTSVVGSDGGWWLPLLGGRAALMPPQYALNSEVEAQPGYRGRVVALIDALGAEPPPAPAGVDALCRAGVTHVYVGARRGGAGVPESGESVTSLDPEALAASPAFSMLYHRDLVWVFALAPGACGAR